MFCRQWNILVPQLKFHWSANCFVGWEKTSLDPIKVVVQTRSIMLENHLWTQSYVWSFIFFKKRYRTTTPCTLHATVEQSLVQFQWQCNRVCTVDGAGLPCTVGVVLHHSCRRRWSDRSVASRCWWTGPTVRNKPRAGAGRPATPPTCKRSRHCRPAADSNLTRRRGIADRDVTIAFNSRLV